MTTENLYDIQIFVLLLCVSRNWHMRLKFQAYKGWNCTHLLPSSVLLHHYLLPQYTPCYYDLLIKSWCFKSDDPSWLWSFSALTYSTHKSTPFKDFFKGVGLALSSCGQYTGVTQIKPRKQKNGQSILLLRFPAWWYTPAMSSEILSSKYGVCSIFAFFVMLLPTKISLYP